MFLTDLDGVEQRGEKILQPLLRCRFEKGRDVIAFDCEPIEILAVEPETFSALRSLRRSQRNSHTEATTSCSRRSALLRYARWYSI